MMVDFLEYRSSMSLKKTLTCSEFRVRYPSSSMRSRSYPARVLKSLGVLLSAREA